jgi:Ca2+-dependent lipid-binding protein
MQMSFDIMENGGRLPEPEGMLSIKLCRGFNLRGGEIFSKTDPFVVLEVREGRPVQSAVVANNTNPVWDEEFHLIVDDRAQQAITLTIKDEDFGW